MRQKLKVLEHGANLTAQERNLAVLDLHEVLTGNQDATTRRLDVAVERRQQRGLTRAGMTDQEDELTRIDLDVNVIECGLVGLRRVDLGDVLHKDDGLDTCLLGHLFAARLRVDGREHRRKIGVVERVVETCDLGGLVALDHRRSGLRGVGNSGKKTRLRRLRSRCRRSHGVGDASHSRLRRGGTNLRLFHASGHGLNGLKTRRAGKRDIAGGIVGKGIGCRLCLICRLNGGLIDMLAL